MSELYDVVIAGAGPVGLLLACELGLGGVSVLVLEQAKTPESIWKALPLGLRGLNTPSIESFYRRGLLGKIKDQEEIPSFMRGRSDRPFGGHFAGIMIDSGKMELNRWRYRLPGPALSIAPTSIEHIETILSEQAESLGVTILRGHGVSKIISQDEHSISVEAGVNCVFRGKWLVGCDGGHSVVRKAAGFDFLGADAKSTGYAMKCDIDDPEQKLKHGFHPTETGMYLKGLPGTLHLMDFDEGKFDRKQDITKEHVQDILTRITGFTDVIITKIDLVSAFSDRTMQATTYRKGRVLLAGDAAHIHPPFGAQGLNLGIGDATNLGWKLAATIRREKENGSSPVDLTLLDTYDTERIPAGTAVLEYTRAQISTIEPSPQGRALRKLVTEVIETTDGANLFMDRFWNLSQKYNMGKGDAHSHPLIGRSAPDFELEDGSRLGPKLETGHGMLLDFKGHSSLKELVSCKQYGVNVDYLHADAKNTCDVDALLIRPDGFVVWVTEDNGRPEIDAARAALEKWFAF